MRDVWYEQQVWVTCQRYGLGPQKQFALVPDLSKNPTHCLLAGQTCADTCQLAGFAGFG